MSVASAISQNKTDMIEAAIKCICCVHARLLKNRNYKVKRFRQRAVQEV